MKQKSNIRFSRLYNVDTMSVFDVEKRLNQRCTDLYCKTTYTGQYCDFSSQTPWKLKISRIKTLHDRATKICSSNKLLNDQINRIRTFMSWNSYPKYVRNSIIKHFQQKKTAVQKDDEIAIKIWIRLPYLGNKGEELVKTCIRKLKRCFKTNVKFFTSYDTKECPIFVLLKIRSLLIRNPMLFTQ